MSGFAPENPWKYPYGIAYDGQKTALLGRGVIINGTFKSPVIKGCSNIRWKDGSNERAMDRHQIRRAFGNYLIFNKDGNYMLQLHPITGDAAIFSGDHTGSLTPFRRAMNAGDPFNRVNALPEDRAVITSNNPSNQVQGSRRAANQAAASTAGNGRKTVPNGSAYVGNPKRVYDSSDYIRYKKLLAKNNNYNDPTFGGDMYHASQTARPRVRH
jgi:hypothetical protein